MTRARRLRCPYCGRPGDGTPCAPYCPALDASLRPEPTSGEQSYPPAYAPGQHWAFDEAWTLLDTLPPGSLPEPTRMLLAGMIAGTLRRLAQSWWAGQRHPVHRTEDPDYA